MWIDDAILRRCSEQIALTCWVPESSVVVLGSANDPEIELDVGACRAAEVPVLKRYGGGGAVVLHGGCAIVSLGLWVKQWFQNKLYFDLANRAVIEALASEWPVLAGLVQDGLSDLMWPGKGENLKVAGTSLFRSRNYLLYQASLLVDVRLDEIEAYLKHPSREPSYRQGRAHRDFLTGVGDLATGATPAAVRSVFETRLEPAIKRLFGDELAAPDPAQFPTLLARAERGVAAP